MNKTMSASNAKNNFGMLMEEVYLNGTVVTITRNNKPVAKVVPVYNYDDSTNKAESALRLNDEEYKEIKKAVRKFKKSFKFSY
jgi:prevent-host-death family protein